MNLVFSKMNISLNLGNNTIVAILFVLCGLGIFLYSIDMMGGSLKTLAGDKLKSIIEKSTNNPLKGLLIGFLVTMFTQSCSATSSLTVSLVAAGLMSFRQSLGIILGANIGAVILTIIMAVFTSINIMPIVSVILVSIGAIIIVFNKSPKNKLIGQAILSFGMVFLGLSFISMSMKTIEANFHNQIVNIFSHLSNVPILGVIVGTLFTFIVQSSSATIGIIQEMYVSGSIPLSGGLAIMLGANIGTTITAFIASIGLSKPAKRVAVANFSIKVISVIVFMLFFVLYKNLFIMINNIIFKDSSNALIISLAHLFFNIVSSFIFLFFLKPFSKLMCFIVKDDKEELKSEKLDYKLIDESVYHAIIYAKNMINEMSERVYDYYINTKLYCLNNLDNLNVLESLDAEIFDYYNEIHDYLMKITEAKITPEQTIKISKYLDVIKNYEKIKYHLKSMTNYYKKCYDNNYKFSDYAKKELTNMFTKVEFMIDESFNSFKNENKNTINAIAELSEEIKELENINRKNHVERIINGFCKASHLDFYVDILSCLERVSDYSNKIANLV